MHLCRLLTHINQMIYFFYSTLLHSYTWVFVFKKCQVNFLLDSSETPWILYILVFLTVFRYSFLVFKLFRPQSFTQTHLMRYQMLFGVGIMLNGAGTVPPSSKYDIHNLLLANFHSTSAFSWKHIKINKFTSIVKFLLK